MRARVLIPTLLVVLIALTSGDKPDPCASTDGPQFKCWLEDQ